MTTTAPALSANDQWTPINAPSTPTVTPLPVRKPSIDALNRPTIRPRRRGGARICTSVWAIEVNVTFSMPAAMSDDVLDVVGHRREQGGDEVAPIGGSAEGRKGERCQTSRSLSFELTASTTITIATVTSSTVEAAG